MLTREASLADGCYTVPAGKLVNAVTWLEMTARPAERLAEPLPLARLDTADHDACRNLYAAVATPWLWDRAFDLAGQDLGPLDIHLAADESGKHIGLVEFFGRPGPDVEIGFFGLVPQAVGKGLGRRLMAATLDLAWASASRVWLHTCHFDHPNALRFYAACGFTAYATGFEITRDPRLEGRLPRAAAPHVPLIDPRK